MAPVSDHTRIRQLLLDAGLEDLISLPEAALDCLAEGLIEGDDEISLVVLMEALVDLFRAGQIQVWAGHWERDSELVPVAEVEGLLRNPARYRFGSPEDLARRVEYVNVDNLWVDPGEP